ncbi:hypothetical protein [Microbulbifer pacificus]|uniref:hypothetical protein n=1 Tax=Microbulbifer pacificus TaxID=407164 RepID=UPI00131A3FD8|nr:hypothetical protein [Microbulbifer pacificus]
MNTVTATFLLKKTQPELPESIMNLTPLLRSSVTSIPLKKVWHRNIRDRARLHSLRLLRKQWHESFLGIGRTVMLAMATPDILRLRMH